MLNFFILTINCNLSYSAYGQIDLRLSTPSFHINGLSDLSIQPVYVNMYFMGNNTYNYVSREQIYFWHLGTLVFSPSIFYEFISVWNNIMICFFTILF